MVTKEQIWKWLDEVLDPEVPALTIIDLGIVRKVELTDDGCKVTMTPTYSGCPAVTRMRDDIIEKLNSKDVQNVEVETVLSPAWTTDWISEKGRVKLKAYGIAPPEDEPDKSVLFADPVKVACPRCDSPDTKLISQFGSTACKAQYQCNSCLEPFEYFKCLR